MTRDQYTAAVENIDWHLEGDGFSLNFYLRGGHSFHDYKVTDIRFDGLGAEDDFNVVRLDRDDHPPVFVALDEVVAIELSTGE